MILTLSTTGLVLLDDSKRQASNQYNRVSDPGTQSNSQKPPYQRNGFYLLSFLGFPSRQQWSQIEKVVPVKERIHECFTCTKPHLQAKQAFCNIKQISEQEIVVKPLLFKNHVYSFVFLSFVRCINLSKPSPRSSPKMEWARSRFGQLIITV